MKKLTRIEMSKETEKIIKDLQKKGLDVEFAKQGKTVKQISHSKKTFDNFLKFVARAKDQPKIKKEVEQYKEKLQKKIGKKVIKEVKDVITEPIKVTTLKPNQMLNNKTGSALLFNYNLENNTKNAINKTFEESSKFLNTYFKPVKDHAKVKKRIEDIQKRLGTRLDLLFSMIDKFSENEYKYPFHKEHMKNHMTDEYEKNITDRLDDIEDILTEYGL